LKRVLRFSSGVAAFILLGMSEYCLMVLSVYAVVGAAISAVALIAIFAVPTPRGSIFLVGAASVLAALPALNLVWILLPSAEEVGVAPSGLIGVGPLPRASIAQVSGFVGGIVFLTSLGALVLWKRVAMRRRTASVSN
jgi:hypothetical protein